MFYIKFIYLPTSVTYDRLLNDTYNYGSFGNVFIL